MNFLAYPVPMLELSAERTLGRRARAE